MNIQTEERVIAQVLSQYADVLNAADATAIPSFYTDDAVFMPNHFRTLSKAELEQSGNDYLQKTNFKIKFEIQNIIIGNGYAFVQANAEATSKDLSTGKYVNVSSRDFFVLRKDEEYWKIFRYIFN